MPGVQRFHQRLFFEMNRRGFFVVAIDNGGNAAFTTQSAGGSLACPLARFGRQCQLIAHV